MRAAATTCRADCGKKRDPHEEGFAGKEVRLLTTPPD
jgi:hypothetical protein